MVELVRLVARHAVWEGLEATRIPGLRIARSTTRAQRVQAVQEPALCYVVQGTKEMTVAGRVYRYRAGEHLVAAVDLPVTGEVVEASSRSPYLCLAVAIDPSVVYELLQTVHLPSEPAGRPAVFVGRTNPRMADVMLRLARCLDDPDDCAVLAPAAIREAIYLLLKGEFGPIVREIGVAGSRTQRIAKAIDHLKRSFTEPLRVEDLAKISGMSNSTFHAHFKKVTTLSPLQYQKQLRLHEARRLLAADGSSVAEIGFRVGYQSASQFSREYARMFGSPPTRDLSVSSS